MRMQVMTWDMRKICLTIEHQTYKNTYYLDMQGASLVNTPILREELLMSPGVHFYKPATPKASATAILQTSLVLDIFPAN